MGRCCSVLVGLASPGTPVLPPNVDQPTGLAAAPARPEKASLGIRNVKNGRGGENLKMGTKDRAEGSKGRR